MNPAIAPQVDKPKVLPTEVSTAPLKADPKTTGGVSYKWEICGGIVGLLLINSVAFLPPYRSGHLDATTMGVFGDFLSGYIGQIIAVVGLCILIGTFRTEKARSKQERFENRFFQLLQLHRDNAEEAELKGVQGRKVFVLLIREWRWIMNIVRYEAQEAKKEFSQLELIQISYICLFYGTGPNSSRMLRKSMENLGGFETVIETKLNDSQLKESIKANRDLTYLPFEGHQSRLGHYYRNLFQLVRFVKDNGTSEADVRAHMSTIRAQLSTHEQALLLLNSMTSMGARWWNEKLIEEYGLVHNIPEDFFDPTLEFDPKLFFKSGYFEEQEKHRKRFIGTESLFKHGRYSNISMWKGPLRDSAKK